MRVVQEKDLGFKGLILTFPAVSISSWPYSFARFFNRLFKQSHLRCSVNRYSSSIAFYMLKKKTDAQSDRIRINIGSGGFIHDDWVCLDYPGKSRYYKTIQGFYEKCFKPIDLCEEGVRFPFRDGSVASIYSSHTLEHLDSLGLEGFFREVSRVLAQDGVCRLSLPDTRKELGALQRYHEVFGIDETYIKMANDICYHVFSPSHILAFADKQSILIKANFDGSKISDLCYECYGIRGDFDSKTPEYHLSYIDINILEILSSKYGLEVREKLRWDSSDESMINPYVFDVTEPHLSFYAELVRK